MDDREPDLDAWLGALATALELDVSDFPVDRLLELARDAAHGVARPAAPLTTFVVGYAAGSGRPLSDAIAVALEVIGKRQAD